MIRRLHEISYELGENITNFVISTRNEYEVDKRIGRTTLHKRTDKRLWHTKGIITIDSDYLIIYLFRRITN